MPELLLFTFSSSFLVSSLFFNSAVNLFQVLSGDNKSGNPTCGLIVKLICLIRVILSSTIKLYNCPSWLSKI